MRIYELPSPKSRSVYMSRAGLQRTVYSLQLVDACSRLWTKDWGLSSKGWGQAVQDRTGFVWMVWAVCAQCVFCATALCKKLVHYTQDTPLLFPCVMPTATPRPTSVKLQLSLLSPWSITVTTIYIFKKYINRSMSEIVYTFVFNPNNQPLNKGGMTG